MSSGSNAPRKPNVAAASASLFKASSRFLHSGERNGPVGAGGSGKGVKRHRTAGASFDSGESSNISEVSRCFGVADHKDLAGGVKSKKRFVGVRQRPSGRWVAEIKDTTQKIRLWLGTFDSAEEGAKAYDNAARALRGANTRTNFVPAMACEGTVPASKTAHLIRLRQMAASKAAEKQATRNVVSKGADDQPGVRVEPSPVNPSPLVRQDLQQSISALDSPAAVDDHTTSLLPSPKPARLFGRRHNAPLASAKLEQVEFEDVDAPPFDDHGPVADTVSKSKLEGTPSPKLEPQLSVTSESFSNAISDSLTAGSPQESSSSPGLLRLPSPRSPFECIQSTADAATGTAASAAVQLVTQTFVEATESHFKSFHSERFPMHRLESLAFPEDSFVTPPPIPFHETAPLEAPTQPSLYSHQISSSCSTNRDIYAVAAPSETDPQETICGGRNFGSTFGSLHQADDVGDDEDGEEAMNLEDEMRPCETKRGCDEVIKEESLMDYPNSEECILRERAFAVQELVVPEFVAPEIPWPDYVLLDEIGMDSTGLLGLDLSCENSGVYTSAFDFSAEAIDRDSCTSGGLLEEHTSKFFRMSYEQPQSPPTNQDFQECVLLTEPELDYSLSPHEQLPRPPLSPRETTTTSSSTLWRLDDTTTAWDGQSSSSTTTVKPQQSGSDGEAANSECTSSQDHEALWSSMDLAPLCMVA